MPDFEELLTAIREAATKPGAHPQVPCGGAPGCAECVALAKATTGPDVDEPSPVALSAVRMFGRDAAVVCACGDVMQVRSVSDEGQYGGSVVAGGERGCAVIDRECPTCGTSMTVEVNA